MLVDLPDLALWAVSERVSRLRTADREADCVIWGLINGLEMQWKGTTLVAGTVGVIGWIDRGVQQRNFSCNRSAVGPGSIPAYTTSLDAALTLVPAGWSTSVAEMMGLPLDRRWRAHLRDHNEPYDPATCSWTDHDCATPAIALCAAALSARAIVARASA